MEYNNVEVRRQDRLLSHDAACALLRDGEHGTLSLVDGSVPYAVPVNYVWDGGHSIYIHCAPEGRKLRCLMQNGKASFCIVGRTQVLPDKFTTRYESIVAACQTTVVHDDTERRKAVELILKKYSPDFVDIGLGYAEKSLHRTVIVRLDIIEWSGKAKK